MSFYAVRVGRHPGVYLTWEECKEQVDRYSSAVYKKFPTRRQAEDFAQPVRPTSAPYVRPIVHTSAPYVMLSAPYARPTIHTSAPYVRPTVHTPVSRPLAIQSVYTDGACSNNQVASLAKAGIGVWFGDGDTRNLSEELPGRATNQRAELYAAVRALEVCDSDKLTLYSDSKYLINSMTLWRYNWYKNGVWCKAVANQDIFERLFELTETIRVTWIHVRGHSGIEGNERADGLATAAIPN